MVSIQFVRQGIVLLAVWLAACLALLVSPAPASAQDEPVTIDLNEYDDSGSSGTATLSPEDEGTRVEISLGGDAITGDHPIHIHTGTCDNFDPNPTFPLTTVILSEVNDRGLSETTVEDVSLVELTAADWVILVHKSSEELDVYLVCGEIERTVKEIPVSGVGASLPGASGRVTVPLILIGFAMACAVVATRSLRLYVLRPRG